MKSPKFILTDNLNKLAELLRMLGYDAFVARSISFDKMITIAVKERRILLTRSSRQANSNKKFSRQLIIAELPLHQLEELRDLIEYDKDKQFTRCLKCNSQLYPISKQNLPNNVPEFVKDNKDEFFICRKCKQVFWRGTHYEDMQAMIKSFFNK